MKNAKKVTLWWKNGGKRGDSFDYENLSVEVSEVDGRRATEIKLIVHPIEDDDEESDEKTSKKDDDDNEKDE